MPAGPRSQMAADAGAWGVKRRGKTIVFEDLTAWNMVGNQPLSSALITLATAGYWGCCLFDLAETGERGVRTFSKPVWVVLLVCTNILGALMRFAVGRPQRQALRIVRVELALPGSRWRRRDLQKGLDLLGLLQHR